MSVPPENLAVVFWFVQHHISTYSAGLALLGRVPGAASPSPLPRISSSAYKGLFSFYLSESHIRKLSIFQGFMLDLHIGLLCNFLSVTSTNGI